MSSDDQMITALDRLLYRCAHAAIDDFEGRATINRGESLADEPMVSEAQRSGCVAEGHTAAEKLLTPETRVRIAIELLAGVPRGMVPTIDLGLGEDVLAFLLSLGATQETRPAVIGRPARAVLITSAELEIDGVRVRAQGEPRPLVEAPVVIGGTP